MGGKTQQRVAGNAKPANSGRIRELLVNQQIGAGSPGNIVTFSALSNKKQGPPLSNVDLKIDDSKERGVKQDAVKQMNDIPTEGHQLPTSILKESILTTPAKENYRLVIRRVGNRDLYTRVKFSEQVEHDDGSTKPVLLPSEIGVKRPPESLDDRMIFPKNDENDKTNHEADEEEKDLEEESDALESDAEIEGDFDELLDRLRPFQDNCTSADTLGETSEKQIKNEVEALVLLKTLIKRFSSDLSIEEWDLVTRSLQKWLSQISKAEHPLGEKFQSNFSVKVFNFIHFLIGFAENLKLQQDNLVEFPMMQSLLEDWANFNSSNMFQELLSLYFKLIAIDNNNNDKSREIIRPMIEAMALIIIEVDPKMVLSHYSLLDNLSSTVEFDSDFREPPNSVFCSFDEQKYKSFMAVCGLLRSNNRVILVSAHVMLSKTLNSICENAIQSVIPTQDQEQVIDEDIPIFPPAALMSILTSRDAIMTALLSDYRVGDTSVTIEHNTDAYACTLSYMFAWDIVIQYIVGVDKEIGHKIIHTLKKLGLIQRLLDNIFILLPPLGQQDSLRFRIYKSDSPTRNKCSTVANPSNNNQHQPWTLENFLKSPLRTTVRRPLNEVELIALHLYFSVALHMPVTVRKWYNNNSNKRLCNLVNEYTVKHVSRVICSLEMESVQEKCLERATQQAEVTNLTIRARPTAKEVYAIYHRDEFQMELTIKLPQNYPLGSVQIDGGKRVGVTDVKWRSWLLQLTTFLAHQNGPILDGIDLWRKNIDKRFEGVEKCTICFSILHSNYQLPKKKCQTCLNMFHNLCLFKWFESSGNSTCPLCRNPW